MTTPEISTTKQPMWHSVDCEKLAEWLETLNRLHFQTPMVPVDQVTRNPVEAVYGAVRELQERIGNLKWEICRTLNGPHRRFFTFEETLASLRPETTSPALSASCGSAAEQLGAGEGGKG